MLSCYLAQQKNRNHTPPTNQTKPPTLSDPNRSLWPLIVCQVQQPSTRGLVDQGPAWTGCDAGWTGPHPQQLLQARA